MPLVLVTDAAGPAISLDDAKDHLRITEDDRDADVLSIIYDAERHIENYLGRTLINKTYRLTLDEFPSVINVPKPPLVSVSSIRYIDDDGVQQTLNASLYTVDTDSTVGRIVPAYEEDWPTIRSVINAVEIEFIAGYGSAPADIPRDIQRAIKLVIGHFNENTEQTSPIVMSELPLGVAQLCAFHRLIPV